MEIQAPFNNDLFLLADFCRLIEKWKIETVFETGTYHGDSSLFFSFLVKTVFTSETDNDCINISSLKFKEHKVENIFIMAEESVKAIRKSRKKLNSERILFFLDAHSSHLNPTSFPILEELKEISKFTIKPIIIIHDFFNPFRLDFGYDSLGYLKLDFEYVKKNIHDIYGSNYILTYNKNACGAKRGVGIFEPI